MAYSWKIMRAAVEQEILFPDEDTFLMYLDKLDNTMTYELVEEKTNDDGSVHAVLRKAYNKNNFLPSERA